MYHYCQYSFRDLFIAATGRDFTDKEGSNLNSLSQQERNSKVLELAKTAGWKTKLVQTSAGEFRAFWPDKKMVP